jgi:hypothetical protein
MTNADLPIRRQPAKLHRREDHRIVQHIDGVGGDPALLQGRAWV